MLEHEERSGKAQTKRALRRLKEDRGRYEGRIVVAQRLSDDEIYILMRHNVQAFITRAGVPYGPPARAAARKNLPWILVGEETLEYLRGQEGKTIIVDTLFEEKLFTRKEYDPVLAAGIRFKEPMKGLRIESDLWGGHDLNV